MEINEKPPSDYFKIGKAILFIIGLWPIKQTNPKMKTFYKIYGIFIISVTLIPYNICSAVDAFNQLLMGKWMEAMPRFSVALAMFLGFIKIVICVFHTHTINGFMMVYEKEEFTYKSTNFFRPNDTIKRCIWLYHIQLAVCFGLVGILIMTDIDTYLKDPIIQPDNTTLPALPFVNWLPYDYSYTPIYEISFCFINFWFFVSANVIIVYDTICMGLMIHTSGQLKILKEALTTIQSRAFLKAQEDSKETIPTENDVNKITKAMFRKCAIHHQGIIFYTAEFERIYSMMIFLQFCISCLMVCFTILVVTNYESPMSSRVTSLIILLCSMWELSVYCYFGNEIISESKELSLAIFQSSLMHREIRHDTLIMMTRCQKPIVFTAGRYVPLSLETFITILKASYSYYAFLRNVSNNKALIE